MKSKEAPLWAIEKEKQKGITISPIGKVKFFCANCQQKIRFERPNNLLKHVISHGRDLGEEEKSLLEKANETRKKHLKFIEWSTPLNQQDIDKDKLRSILEQNLNLKVKTTSTNSGFLLDCPKCQTPNKLFYNFEGRQFLCLNYKDCGFKPFNLTKLKKTFQKTIRSQKV
jgi:uncharacterized protein YheU (UPF0270 family)